LCNVAVVCRNRNMEGASGHHFDQIEKALSFVDRRMKRIDPLALDEPHRYLELHGAFGVEDAPVPARGYREADVAVRRGAPFEQGNGLRSGVRAERIEHDVDSVRLGLGKKM